MKILEDMEATLMRMAKSGHVGTPLKDFADLIMPHLTSMEGAINNSHASAQTTMDTYGAEFATCTTAKTTADSEASTLLIIKMNQSTAHKNCRTAEGVAKTSYLDCMTGASSLGISQTTACDAYNLANKAPNVNLLPQPGQGQSYRSWLMAIRDWVVAELATLDAANQSCVNATMLNDNKNLECEGADGQGGKKLVHSTLKTLCNANQTALEGTTCSYAAKVESSCSAYSTCHANAKNSYDAGKTNLLSEQSNRMLEYSLVKRLMCFCNLFSQAGGADLASADIDTCKNTNHSATHLMLTLPSPPPVPGACQAVLQKPCTSSYTSTEYGSLPSNAQAATCQACPSAPTTLVCSNGWTVFKTNQNCAGAQTGAAAKITSGATPVGCQQFCAGHQYMGFWTGGSFQGSCRCYDDCSSSVSTHVSNQNTVCSQATPTTPTTTTTTVDCTTQVDKYGTAGCLPFTNFGVNGKSNAMWNYCVPPTQAIADAASAQLSAVFSDHQWMLQECEKTCCEYPDLSHLR